MRPRHYNLHGRPSTKAIILYDKWLIGALLSLILIGLTMVASSSIMISIKFHHHPYHYIIRQVCLLSVGLLFGFAVIRTKSSFWQKYSLYILGFSFLILILVLIPGIGRVVNGSRRWLSLGPIRIQVSEIMKLAIVLYIASYVVRQEKSLFNNAFGFLKPLLICSLASFLLLMEPDFGATVVITSTVLAMLFMAGIKLRYIMALIILSGSMFLTLAISSPYRLARITAFLDPWADQYNSGYQLTQSLIAFGQGSIGGVGLGESVQKLFYLPEAHTDFLFAVLAEELGLIGVLSTISLYVIIVFRGMTISYSANNLERKFASLLAFGITFWLGIQAFINMAVNSGLLPTKGLTLPFLSYGGASIIINCIMLAMLLRIDHENRRDVIKTSRQGRSRG